jgi:hypothetical protein
LRINLRQIFAGLLIVLIPIQASAITLTEYHLNLQSAITALDSLAQLDETETQASYRQRITETISSVKEVIPESQSVESGQSGVTVDNSWLHDRLDELERADAANAVQIRSDLIERLRAIDERVTELQSATAQGISRTEASARLSSILARPEFTDAKNQKGNALNRLLDRFIRWLAGIFPERAPITRGSGSPLTLVAQIFVIALALSVIVYVGFKLFKHFRRRERSAKVAKKREARIVLGEKLEPDATATDLLSEAEALARAGDLRAAIRKAYIALLVELGDRKLVSLAQHKTNRDYVRAVRSYPKLHDNMNGLTESFERHWYGFAQTSQADWLTFREGYRSALHTNE